MSVTLRDIDSTYRAGDPLTMLTAYDAPMAHLVDAGGVDMILVGDSAAQNHMGYESTHPLELDDAVANAEAVIRGAVRAFVVADLPFGTYGASLEQGVESAARFVKAAGVDAVKLETAPAGETTVALVDRLTELVIPVQGHLGLTPQRSKELGAPSSRAVRARTRPLPTASSRRRGTWPTPARSLSCWKDSPKASPGVLPKPSTCRPLASARADTPTARCSC